MLRRLRDDTRLHDGALLWRGGVRRTGQDVSRRLVRRSTRRTRTETPIDLQSQIAPIHEIARRPRLAVAGRCPVSRPTTSSARWPPEARARRNEYRGLDGGQGPRATGRRQDHPGQHDDARRIAGGADGSRRRASQRFGVPPERIVDFLTLTGDTRRQRSRRRQGRAEDRRPAGSTSTATSTTSWRSAAEIGGKVGENLRAALEWLPQAKRLVTVRADCDLSAASRRRVRRTRDARRRTRPSCGNCSSAGS